MTFRLVFVDNLNNNVIYKGSYNYIPEVNDAVKFDGNFYRVTLRVFEYYFSNPDVTLFCTPGPLIDIRI